MSKITTAQKELAYQVAKQFMDNYKGISDPHSPSYLDGHCAAWLADKVTKFGYASEEAMAKACRAVLKAYKPAPKQGKKQKVRIEVVKYMGKWGSFATCESEMYRAMLVGANGQRQNLPDTRACYAEYGGHPERKYAVQRAEIWAALLGCPTVFVDEVGKKEIA